MKKDIEKTMQRSYSRYLQGLSLEQVANELGITRQSVYKSFKKRGFTLRGKNFQPEQFFDDKKFTLRDTGYYALSNGSRTLMHRYVWEFHNGKIPDGYDVHHIDENKANNSIENLECLPKYEHTQKYSPNNNQFGEGRRKVVMMDLEGNDIRIFETSSIAASELGIDRSGINMAINGKLKTYKKHRWRYLDK